MEPKDFERAAQLAKNAGDYELADKMELAATQAYREAAEFRVKAREDAWEDRGVVDDYDPY